MERGGSDRDEARTLAEASLWVQEAETPQEVLERANASARLLLETSCSYCAVRAGEVLLLAAHSGFRDPETARRWRLPIGQGIGGRVVERGETLVVRDYLHDPRRERFSKSLIDAEGLRSAVAAPIRSGNRVIGVLYAAEHRLRYFTSSEVELMTLFARSVSAALTAAEHRETLRQELALREQTLRRTEEIQQLLAKAATTFCDDSSLEAALTALADWLEGLVLVRDPRGHLLARAGEETSSWPGEPMVFPICAAKQHLGDLQVMPAHDLDTQARRCLEQVTSLIALWMLKERAALHDDLGAGSRFLEELLHGKLGKEDAVLRQASILGIDLTQPRVVVCVGVHQQSTTSASVGRQAASALREAAQRRRLEPVLDLWGQDAVVMVRVGSRDLQTLRQVVMSLVDEVGARLGGTCWAAGIGRICFQLGDYAESYKEANLALEVARAAPPERRIRTYEELGFYGLVARATDLQILDALVQHTLRPLLDSDTQNGTRYVQTLAAYLRADRHLKPAAAALHVHVNTLRYRLDRIEELLGVDLDDVEARFLLELAVRLLQEGRGSDGANAGVARAGGRADRPLFEPHR